MFAITVDNLQKSFSVAPWSPPKKVLDSMSFKVKAARTTGFIGVNGSGKTTTLKCILGFIFADSGRVQFLGESLLSPQVKSQIGYLPERPYYYDYLTARQFLKFHWDISAGEGKGSVSFDEACLDVLQTVDLKQVENKLLRSFSKGMLQRIGMAQALIRQPQILILDEPMSGLDPDGRLLIKDIIRSQKAKGRTIFFSSHLLSDMDELCDDLVVIHDGKCHFQGATSEFAQQGKVEDSFRSLRQRLLRGDTV